MIYLLVVTQTDSLCHCVSRDLKMGKGIAVEFKKRYGNVPELHRQNAAIGTAAVLQRDNAFVYYLITKERYFHKPTLAAVQQSCEWMRDHALEHNVKSICMPRIACGLDGLEWSTVRDMLCHVFCDSGIIIHVYTLPGWEELPPSRPTSQK